MTPREQLDAIYRWIRYHIVYRDAPSLNDWLQAAWQGMTAHYGDCYTFQMTARAMLTAAGIENRLIDTLPFYNVHCWNLVNIGEGWYHFDTTPFEDGASFCYVTTADLQNRSWRYPYSHRFDRDRFPDPV